MRTNTPLKNWRGIISGFIVMEGQFEKLFKVWIARIHISCIFDVCDNHFIDTYLTVVFKVYILIFN